LPWPVQIGFRQVPPQGAPAWGAGIERIKSRDGEPGRGSFGGTASPWLRDRPWRVGGGRDREPGGVQRVAHGGTGRAVCAVAALAEKSPGQGRALVEQVVEHAAQVLGGGRLAVLKRGSQPGLADQLLDERAADAVRALDEPAG
jgi:hypothetical protein